MAVAPCTTGTVLTKNSPALDCLFVNRLMRGVDLDIWSCSRGLLRVSLFGAAVNMIWGSLRVGNLLLVASGQESECQRMSETTTGVDGELVLGGNWYCSLLRTFIVETLQPPVFSD